MENLKKEREEFKHCDGTTSDGNVLSDGNEASLRAHQ